MAGIAVVTKTDMNSIMIRLILDREIVDRIEVDDVVFLDEEPENVEELMSLAYRE